MEKTNFTVCFFAFLLGGSFAQAAGSCLQIVGGNPIAHCNRVLSSSALGGNPITNPDLCLYSMQGASSLAINVRGTYQILSNTIDQNVIYENGNDDADGKIQVSGDVGATIVITETSDDVPGEGTVYKTVRTLSSDRKSFEISELAKNKPIIFGSWEQLRDVKMVCEPL